MNFVERLENALAVAGNVLDVLLVDDPPVDNPFFHDKLVGETLLLLLSIERAKAGGERLRQTAELLAQRLCPFARSERVLTRVQIQPSLLPELCLGHFGLSRLGFPDTKFDRQIRSVSSDPRVGYCERTPWKNLESRWLWNLGGIRPEAADHDTLNSCIISRGVDVLNCQRSALYALTHSVFYLTDFGHSPACGVRGVETIAREVETALIRCLDDDDFDLVAELLCFFPMAGLPFSPMADLAWQTICRVEDELGFLPSLSLRESSYSERHGDERRVHLLTEGYHTCYTMGLLCAALLNQYQSLDWERPASAEVRGSIASDSYWNALLLDSRRPQWMRHYHSVGTTDDSAFSSFPGAVLLLRAVRGGDIARVRSLLGSQIENGTYHTGIHDDCAALLERMILRSEEVDESNSTPALVAVL